MTPLPRGPWRRLVAVDPWAQMTEVRSLLENALASGRIVSEDDPYAGPWVRIVVDGSRFHLPPLVGTDFRHGGDPSAAARQLLRAVSKDADLMPGWQNRVEELRDEAVSLMLAFTNGIEHPVATEFTAVHEDDGLPSLRLWNSTEATWRSLPIPTEARIAAARLHGHAVHLERRSGQWILRNHPVDKESAAMPVDILCAMRAIEGNPR